MKIAARELNLAGHHGGGGAAGADLSGAGAEVPGVDGIPGAARGSAGTPGIGRSRLLDSRETVESRLAEFRQGLPVFPAGKKAEAELLLALEKMVSRHGLRLTRREADAEREAGDLYETSITCDWEGDLPALVNFLYAQQSQGVVSDVRQLSVQPAGGQQVPAGRLKGTFTMDYAYRRETGATESTPAVARPAPVAEAAQP